MVGVRILAAGVALVLTATSARAQEGFEREPEPEDEVPRLRGEELGRELPGLELQPWPSPLSVGLFLGSLYPYQSFGAGLTTVVYPIPWLRLEGLYSAGATGSSGEFVFSNYAELVLGLRLVGVLSEREVDLMPEEEGPRPWGVARPKPLLSVAYPSSHQLFVEGGWITGLLSYQHCPGSCPDPEAATDPDAPPLPIENRQLFFPLAGLRYIYFVRATSKRQEMDRKLLIQTFAQAIFAPVNDNDHVYLSQYGDRIGRSPVGVRVGVEFPTCLRGCVRFNIVGGYAPLPATPLFGIGIAGGG